MGFRVGRPQSAGFCFCFVAGCAGIWCSSRGSVCAAAGSKWTEGNTQESWYSILYRGLTVSWCPSRWWIISTVSPMARRGCWAVVIDIPGSRSGWRTSYYRGLVCGSWNASFLVVWSFWCNVCGWWLACRCPSRIADKQSPDSPHRIFYPPSCEKGLQNPTSSPNVQSPADISSSWPTHAPASSDSPS